MIRCFPVTTTTRAPDGTTNAYLIDGPATVLVDPAGRSPALDEAVETTGVEHVVITHTHADHVGAVWTYADQYDATVWGLEGRDEAFAAATGRPPDETFRDGDEFTAGVTVRYMPGHCHDHVVFVIGNDALVGDLAVASGSVVVGRDGDMRAYLTSLRRLRAMGLDTLHPGHGPSITDPKATLARLIEHRLSRERRVLAAVQSGAETIDEVVDLAYDKSLDGVRDLAAETVVAHLAKLKRAGRIDHGAVPTDPKRFSR